MEGISPTLAFVALVLGLAGHPHDGAENARPEAEQPLAFKCAGLAIVIPGEEAAAADGFDHDLLDSDLPPMARGFAAMPTRPNQTYSTALEGSIMAAGDQLAKSRPSGADRNVDALLTLPAEAPSGTEDGTGCDSLLPKP